MCLWQFYKDDPNNNITYTESFKFKAKINGRTLAAGNDNDVEVSEPLKYLSNFWRTLEMSLIINLFLTSSATYIIINSAGAVIYVITDTKLYVPVVTLSTKYNGKLLKELESGLKEYLTGVKTNQK